MGACMHVCVHGCMRACVHVYVYDCESEEEECFMFQTVKLLYLSV